MTHIRLPHSVITKSPGLLPMLYTPRELAAIIGTAESTLRDWLAAGAPHTRDLTGHIWIHGKEFAAWVISLRQPKRERKLTDQEAYCMRCNTTVEMINVSTKVVKGKLTLIRGICPNCGCKVNRGGRLPTYQSNQFTGKDSADAA